MTALVLQDSFGGRLMKTRVGDAWHFYNEIGGEIFDVTSTEFVDAPSYRNEPATREEALNDTTTQQYRQMFDAFVTNWQKRSSLAGASMPVACICCRLPFRGWRPFGARRITAKPEIGRSDSRREFALRDPWRLN